MKKYLWTVWVFLLCVLPATPAMADLHTWNMRWQGGFGAPRLTDWINEFSDSHDTSNLAYQIVAKYEDGDGFGYTGSRSLDMTPGFAWSYAVVKYGNNVMVIYNDGSNHAALNISGLSRDISSVVFFAAPVPEPSTMLLLGSGLAGLAIMRKLRQKRQ